ncbi:LOW QUALITY PROTEIN: uncharacterized protein LOC116596872 [Mustela erminea]|uniref:LOW QUALITY PROTEIN: uncharacterized protein LOC116596872 n=1 Tax=Mustela erminea TaxID=36723 RepID=UPI001387331B|nr:LOW QUALITY PROTEIN: uncharacterized protein LOC116596872 [Mustela erminea]
MNFRVRKGKEQNSVYFRFFYVNDCGHRALTLAYMRRETLDHAQADRDNNPAAGGKRWTGEGDCKCSPCGDLDPRRWGRNEEVTKSWSEELPARLVSPAGRSLPSSRRRGAWELCRRALQRVAVAALIRGTGQPEFGAEGQARPWSSEFIHTGKRGPVNMIPFTTELPDFRRRRQGALECSRKHRVALLSGRPRDRTGLCAAVLTPSAAPSRRRPGCGRRPVRHSVYHRPCSLRCAFCSCDSSVRGCLPHDLSPASPIPQPLPSSGRSAKGARPLTGFGKPLLLCGQGDTKPLPRPSGSGPQVRPATPPAARRDALPSRCSPHSPRPCPGGVELLLAVSAPSLPHRLTPARPAVPAGSFLRRGASSPPPLPSTRDSVTDAHLLVQDSLPHDATSSTRPESFFSDSEGCSADGGQ